MRLFRSLTTGANLNVSGRLQNEETAIKYVKGDIDNEEMALAGARDIIAEWVSENAVARQRVRNCFNHKAIVSSHVIKGKESDAVK